MNQLPVHTQYHLHLDHIHNGGAALWNVLLARHVIEHEGAKGLHSKDRWMVLVWTLKNKVKFRLL